MNRSLRRDAPSAFHQAAHFRVNSFLKLIVVQEDSRGMWHEDTGNFGPERERR